MNKPDHRSETFAEKLLLLDRFGAGQMLAQAADQETPLKAVERLVVPALEEIGKRWEQGSVALAEVYMSSRICEELADQILPPSSAERINRPKIGIALLDDYHALGKMIVCAALRASGYEIQDYGRLTAAELAERICRDSVSIILVSTLMLRSALQVKTLRELLDAAGSPAKIIVGGAPFRFDPELWQEVGADGTGNNAAEAVRAAARFVEELAQC
ncbi:cobalamin B12-binding domain-containing protein [Candidatus Electronema sp. PJ]|uniref:cobalamin B12-binding domain-containing protein n=1 Tax=Candidatus Electronema sp. PJ TaxID=3401572 RepID=UPI003AA9AC08